MCTVWHVKYILWIFICIKHASWLKESTSYTHTHSLLSTLLYKATYTQCVQTLSLVTFNTKISQILLENFHWTSAAQFFVSWGPGFDCIPSQFSAFYCHCSLKTNARGSLEGKKKHAC